MTDGSNALRTRLVRLAAEFAEGMADAIEAHAAAEPPANHAARAKALVPTAAELRRAKAALRGTR
jgi:hypothetical protein